jgi:hypothetical protein
MSKLIFLVGLALDAALAAAPVFGQIRTVVVSPVAGNPLASGDALRNAVNSIPSPSSVEPWLVKVEPGLYDLGQGNAVVMRPWVDIEGSGIESTTIIALGDPLSPPSASAFFGASNAELRSLTVLVDASPGAGVAISNLSASPRLYRVRVRVTGGNSTRGIENADAAPILEEVEVAVSGLGTNEAVTYSSKTLTSVELRRCRLTATDGATNVGIATSGNLILREIRDSEIEASRGRRNYALRIGSTVSGTSSTTFFLSNTEIDGVGGSEENYGIFVSGSNFGLKLFAVDLRAVSGTTSHGVFVSPATNVATVVVSSDMRGNTGVVTSTGSLSAANSTLNGGPVTAASEVCAAVVDENLAFFSGHTCP